MLNKSKEKEKDHKTNKIQKIYIPSRDQEVMDALRLFQAQYKNRVSRNYEAARYYISQLLDTDNVPRFNIKKQI